MFDITAYGARRSDDQDDSNAIATIVAEAGTLGLRGGTIYVPEGTFYLNSPVTIPENFTLKGAGKSLSKLIINHTGNGIVLEPSGGVADIETTTLHSAVEDLWIDLPDDSEGYGIYVNGNRTAFSRLQFSGGSVNSWFFAHDRCNILEMADIHMGGVGDYDMKGNGFRFFNSDPETYIYNGSDAEISHAYVQLNANNTVGISCEGPSYDTWANGTSYSVGDIRGDSSDNSLHVCDVAHTSHASDDFATDRSNNPSYWSSTAANKIANIAFYSSQVTSGSGSLSGDIAIDLNNASYISFYKCDVENVSTTVRERGLQSFGSISEYNHFEHFRALNFDAAYTTSGSLARNSYICCDNFPGSTFLTGWSDTDTILPKGLWFTNASGGITTRVWDDAGQMQFDDGGNTGAVKMVVAGNSPQIAPVETNKTFFVGRSDSTSPVGLYPWFATPPEAITATGAVSIHIQHTSLSNSSGSSYAVTLAAPNGNCVGKTKTISMAAGDGTNNVTMALTNVVGGSASSSALFNAAGESLVMQCIQTGASSYAWLVLNEYGVTLS